jgi:succinylglutamate desuccinylase
LGNFGFYIAASYATNCRKIMVNRIVGTMGGTLPGPLVVVTAALHGNEPAGVQALEAIFNLLESENIIGFKGRFIGLIGNVQAYATHSRFMLRDFNRVWRMDLLAELLAQHESHLQGEDLEFVQLYNTICREVEASKPKKILFLDLHTTSAGGGLFCIPTDEGESLAWAKLLQAPVVLGLYDQVDGTLLRFGVSGYFSNNTAVVPTLGVAFEAGQHDHPDAVVRSIAAILKTLEYAGCLPDVGEGFLESTGLQRPQTPPPLITRLVTAHHINPGDGFVMRPGYVNFQPVLEGEPLADDANGPIVAPFTGMILMPLYQSQGSDGFFLVRSAE